MDLPLDRVLRPESLDDALALLASDPALTPIAGGTDLVVQLRDGRRRAGGLLDLSRVGLAWIRDVGNGVQIGAGTTMDAIAASPLVRHAAPGLADAAGLVGAWPIQCRATLGGNLANASPAADTAPPLLVADAAIELVSASGRRTVPAADFFLGPGHTVRRPDELLHAVRVPAVPDPGSDRFAKLGPRREQIISMVSVALRTGIGPAGALRGVRVAVGSSAPVPVRARAAEAALEGRVPDHATRLEAARALQLDITPIDDVRAPASYRRIAAAVLLERFLAEVAGV